MCVRLHGGLGATWDQAVLDSSDIVLLGVRPGDASAALDGLRFRRDHIVVSLMAVVSCRLNAFATAGGVLAGFLSSRAHADTPHAIAAQVESSTLAKLVSPVPLSKIFRCCPLPAVARGTGTVLRSTKAQALPSHRLPQQPVVLSRGDNRATEVTSFFL